MTMAAGDLQTANVPPGKPGVICQPRAPQLLTLERRREAGKISIKRWLSVANVHFDTLRNARRGAKLRPTTLLRLSQALDDLTQERPAARPPAAIMALIRLTEIVVTERIRRRRGLAALIGTRARSLAIYLTAVELEIENAEIARAIGCKRQNIHQLRLDVEELRDHAKVDALLDACAAMMKGEM